MTVSAEPDIADYLASLGRGDIAAALAAVEAQRAAGMTLTQIATEIIGPSQVAVGSRWQSAKWTVADEHAASSISEAVVHLLGTAVAASATERPPVVLACAENEWHTLPALLAAVTLRDHGWRVLYLGASMPAEHLVAFLVANQPLALAISCSLPLNLPGIRRQVAQAHALGLPVLAGGRALGVGDRRATALGIDSVAQAGAEASQVLEGWLASTPALNEKPFALNEIVLADRVRSMRDGLAETALDNLRSTFPAMSAYDGRQLQRTLEDLAYTLDFLAAAVDVGDPSILADYLGWLADLLGHRGVPPLVLGTSVEALTAALEEHPEARRVLAEVAAAAGIVGPVLHNASRRPLATPSSPRNGPRRRPARAPREFAAVVAAVQGEWERRAMISTGALAVAEALSGIADPIEAATVFMRTAAKELGLATSIVTMPVAGEPVTMGVPSDPFWTRHPASAMAGVRATLGDGRARGFRAGDRDLLALAVGALGTARTTLVSASPPGGSATESAVALTALSKVLATALRAAHLEQDNRFKEAFLSVISHELRTPLNAVIGYAGLLRQVGVEVLSEKQTRQVEHIQAAGAHLLDLVNNVIDLVELETGFRAGRSEVVPLRDLLERVAVAAPGGRAGVSIRIRCGADLQVETTRRHLERAVANVVANAIQFSPKGGVVTISARAGRTATRIHIRDSGTGMDPGQVAQLGQPFLQLSRGITRTHDGMGLGLAAARANLLAIGGSSRIRSAPGRGTDVTLILPAAKPTLAEGLGPRLTG